MHLDEEQLTEIRQICKSHNVKHIYLFGSALGSDFKPDSDYDFLVRFRDMEFMDYFDNYMDLKSDLEKYLKRKVDLLEEQALKNPYLIRNINKSKELVYG